MFEAHTSICVCQKAYLTPYCYSPITSSMGQQNPSLSDLEYGLAIGLDGCQKMFLSPFTHRQPGRTSGRLDGDRRPDGPHPLRRPGDTPLTSRLSLALICYGRVPSARLLDLVSTERRNPDPCQGTFYCWMLLG